VSATGRCAACHRQVRLRSRSSEGRICSNCAAKRNSGPCSRCGEHRRIAGIDPAGGRWCERCRDRQRRADTDHAHRTAIVAAASRVEPELQETAVLAALGRAATSRRALRWLAEHLDRHPRALTEGPTSTLQVLDRFVAELTAAGAVRIVTIHPICSGCGRRRRAHVGAHRDACLCSACYMQLLRPLCAGCGHPARPYRRDDDGTICVRCARRRSRQRQLDELTAAIAERLAEAVGPIDGELLSGVLDRVAGQPHTRRLLLDLLATGVSPGRIATTAPAGARLVAELCAAGIDLEPASCVDCDGPAQPLVTYGGTIRCRPCAKVCPHCRRSAKEPNEPICRRCRVDPLRPLGTCSDCHRPDRRLDQQRRCRPCREHHDHRCGSCDQIRPLTATTDGWRCHRCALSGELDQLLGSSERFLRLRTAILAADNPELIRDWLARPLIAGLLARLAAHEGALEHADLDEFAETSGVEHLRAVLVAAGLLDDSDRSVERLQITVGPLIAAIVDPADRTIVRAWLTWKVLPRLRRRVEQKLSTEHSGPNARDALIGVTRFLAPLHLDGRNLTGCTQADLDTWFAHRGRRAQLRPFLLWTQQRHHLPADLQIPPARSTRPAPPTGDRQALARRLLTDDTIAPDDRVAGALLVFYAQPVTRIVALTTDDLATRDDGTLTITLAGMPVELLEPFATLARQLPITRTNGVADQLPTRWLFPGKRAGRPINPDSLGRRLRALGIPPRLSRATALAELAIEIPPAVLAELVGIAPGTAARWAAITGGNWAAYAPSRTPSLA
jgi:hypothetical protein